jgi:hypothetical protein
MRRALKNGLITTLGVPQHALRRPPDLARGAACGFGFSLAARRERSAERILFDVNLLGGRDPPYDRCQAELVFIPEG